VAQETYRLSIENRAKDRREIGRHVRLRRLVSPRIVDHGFSNEKVECGLAIWPLT